MSDARPISADAAHPEAPLQIEMSERGSTIVIKVSGMAAVEVVGQFSRALQEAAARKPRLLAVDLSGLSFISSTGLGGIVAAHVTCRKNDTLLCLINPKPFIREILDLTKLSSLFEICDSLAEAEQLAGAREHTVSGSERQTEPIPIRRIAYFNGNVQGIGFRYTACQIAKDHAVVGYVKNLLDGRVEIIAEGLPPDVDRFVANVEQIMKSYIEFTTSTDSTATAEYASFGIEY